MKKKQKKKTKKKKQSLFSRLLRYFIILTVFGFVSGSVVATGIYFHFKSQIPKIDTIFDYKPNMGTKVYSYDGQLIAEFFKNNKRNIIPYDKIPKLQRLAFVAGEDADFYHHFGINPKGMLRAAIKYALTGIKQGGSTITQQLAKSFLSSERTFSRKFKDIILALELERHLSKEEILYMYLNEIYLGANAYGVESASEAYFGKHDWELSLAQMATLAGLPKYPTKASPIHNPKLAIRRRNYVLRRMFDENFITKQQYEQAKNEKLVVHPQKPLFLDKAPYFSEKVRRYILKKYGYKKVYEEGLTVYTTLDLRATKLVHQAVFKGMRELAKRQGYRRGQDKSYKKSKKFKGETTNPLYHINLKKDFAKYQKRHRKVFGKITPQNIIRGKLYQGVVLKTLKDKAIVQVGTVKRAIHLEDLLWAKKFNPGGRWQPIKKTSDVFKVGDVILVRATDKPGTRDPLDFRKFNKPLPKDFYFVLEPVPSSQTAVIVKDPYSGYVKAIVGGYDFEISEFDRTSQSCRQPGSSIKPIFYSQALELRKDPKTNKKKPLFTEASLILDAPVTVADMSFKPANYEKTFKGEVTFWEALVHSMNAPSIRILQALGLRTAIKGAKKLGIKSEIKPEYGSILGSSCVTLDELTNAYAHFPNQGKSPHTTYILKIYDKFGKLLENHSVYYDSYISSPEKLSRLEYFSKRSEKEDLSPEVAFIMTQNLKDVITFGTGISASDINYRMHKNVGGKTGTTNDYLDAWFIGFSPNIVTGVWVGNDKHGLTLGTAETGSKAALPIWKDFMKRYLKDFPYSNYEKPQNVIKEKIDRKTGLINKKSGTVMYFIKGTEPQKTVEEKNVLDPSKGMNGIF